jgi:hypothetical protein
VKEKQFFTVQVAIMDASGNVVPLNGTEIYIGLLEVGEDHPLIGHLMGDRFEDTQGGMSTFNRRWTGRERTICWRGPIIYRRIWVPTGRSSSAIHSRSAKALISA